MPIKASACLEVGTALAAAVCGAADIGVRLVVLHENSSITEVTITAASGARKQEVSRSYMLHTYNQNLQITKERSLGFVRVVQMLEEIIDVVVCIVAYKTGAWPVSLQMELIVEIETEIDGKQSNRI